MRSWMIRLVLMVAAALVAGSAFAADVYVVHDLGSLGGVRGSGAVALNGAGTSAGYSFIPNANSVHAMLNRYGVVSDLGTLGGNQSIARSVNSDGTVVGWAFDASNFFPLAFTWRDGAMTELPGLGYPRSDARAINASGLIVGSAFRDAQTEHACWWQDGAVIDAGTLGGNVSRAYDVNARGVMCGMAGLNIPLADVHPFLAKLGEPMIDLGTLGGEAAHGFAINEQDHVVGWSYISRTAPESRAFIWKAGRMTQLADLGGPSAAAYNLDENDTVVGDATYPGDVQVATLWKDGSIADLNLLVPDLGGWRLLRAWAIDEHGAIVGEGTLDGSPRAFLLTPVQATSVPPASAPAGVTFAAPSPNPVRGSCRFAWSLPAAGDLRLELFDVRGRRVRVLAEGPAAAGDGAARWDARDAGGRPVGSGVYWARLSTPGATLEQRIVVTR